jgi:hypothetical protein
MTSRKGISVRDNVYSSLLMSLVLTGLWITSFGLFSTVPAHAQEATYDVTGVKFTDGEVLNGYFDYNPIGTLMSSYDITTSGGLLSPATYTYFGPTYDVYNDYIFQFGGSDLGPLPIATLVLDFSPALTSSGPQFLAQGVYSGIPGTFSGSAEQEQTSNGKQIQDLMIDPQQIVNAGKLITTTPEPPTALTLALGLGILSSLIFYSLKRRPVAV